MGVRKDVSKGSIGFLVDNDISRDVCYMLQERSPAGTVVVHGTDIGSLKDGQHAGYCRKRRLVLITEDQDIRSTPLEVRAFLKAKVGFVEVDAGTRIGADRLDTYRRHLRGLVALLDEPVPFARRLTRARLRPISMTGRVRKSEL